MREGGGLVGGREGHDWPPGMVLRGSAGERGGNNLIGFTDFCTENGSNQDQNPALTGLCVPRLHENGSHAVHGPGWRCWEDIRGYLAHRKHPPP